MSSTGLKPNDVADLESSRSQYSFSHDRAFKVALALDVNVGELAKWSLQPPTNMNSLVRGPSFRDAGESGRSIAISFVHTAVIGRIVEPLYESAPEPGSVVIQKAELARLVASARALAFEQARLADRLLQRGPGEFAAISDESVRRYIEHVRQMPTHAAHEGRTR